MDSNPRYDVHSTVSASAVWGGGVGAGVGARGYRYNPGYIHHLFVSCSQEIPTLAWTPTTEVKKNGRNQMIVYTR